MNLLARIARSRKFMHANISSFPEDIVDDAWKLLKDARYFRRDQPRYPFKSKWRRKLKEDFSPTEILYTVNELEGMA